MKLLGYPLLLLCILYFGLQGYSQPVYRIYLTNKNNTTYNPFQYLHPKAIERRILHGLNLYDSSDFPINSNYLKKVTKLSDSIIGFSRWMNAIFIYASIENIEKIKNFPFVKVIEPVEKAYKNSIATLQSTEFDTVLTLKELKLLTAQIDRMNGKLLKANHLDGTGVRIAIIDVGFKTFATNPAFEHIRKRNGIIEAYDFVKKKPYKNLGMMHGTNVFSCIGGQFGDLPIGLATGAEYLLARTESVTEFFNEEENWLLAAEWADKLGADIINSSLGYTYQRYLPENMDGKTAFVSKAAQIAVDKGILVVSAAGNEGISSWKRVAAPGDAAGVLTVGAINPTTGIHSDFSSFGPSWDRRIKPEVCAYGTTVVSDKNGLNISEGTSFSSPLVAGFAACLKQLYPNLKNTELKDLICQSGDLWPYYDYAHGYGVPQPYFLFKDTLPNVPTLTIIMDDNDITLYPIEWDTALHLGQKFTNLKIKTDSIFPNYDSSASDSILVFDKVSNKPPIWIKEYKTSLPNYLFYHIKNNKGYLDRYYVMDLYDEKNGSVTIHKDISEKPFTIEFFYKGFYKQIEINE